VFPTRALIRLGAALAAILAMAVIAALRLPGDLAPAPAPTKAPSPSAPALENQATAADVKATRDAFGIEFLRPTLPQGTYWKSSWEKPRSFDGVDPEDPWFDGDHGSATYRVDDGQLFISGNVPRMYIHDPHMERQWGDVEITMYVLRVSDDRVPYAGMTAVARSNHLDTGSGTRRCDTRGIGARIRYDGHADFEKETAFPVNEATHNTEIWPHGMPYGRWIGYKFLVFDKPEGVHLELWMDLSNGEAGGRWRQVAAMVDDGRVLGSVPCAPGIDPKLALTKDPSRPGSETGLPNLTVYFRSDGVHQDGLVYKWGSVREIAPR
jgi:hypothetical protein